MNKLPKISVIIPVYKAELYIETCVRSLFEQTLDDIEYIFINDCTPDKSMEIVNRVMEDYPLRKNQVKILHHEINKGISTSRNTGLNNATGVYIIHCDSDDWIDADLYEKLYNKAVEDNADIVMCDYKIVEAGNSRINIHFYDENHRTCVKALLVGKLSPYLWNKLIKKKQYDENKIYFPDGINIREDFFVLVKLFFYSTKISKISDTFYYYRKHDKSISRAIRIDENPEFTESRIIASKLAYNFLESQEKVSNYKQDILNSKLILKILLILNSSNKNYWNKIFPEANSKIFKSDLSYSHKIILWSNSNNLSIITKMYKFLAKSRLVIKKLIK